MHAVVAVSRRPLLCLMFALCAGGLAVSGSATADDLNIAVAANFLGTLQQLAPLFEKSSGHHLVISSASSGQLYGQIKQGAPFDVFLSADSNRPKQLESDGLAVPGSRFTYAIGTLVLWSPREGVVDRDCKVLRSAKLHMLAIADPNNAPYGAAAEQVLTSMGLWDSLNAAHHIAVAQDITQSYQFAASGNAEMAFIAKSQLSTPNPVGSGSAGSSCEPPPSQYSAISQDAIVLANAAHAAAAQSFAHWLASDSQALAAIRTAGYRVGE
jgi:molybdate transport system substrate-binding protein